MATKEKFLVVRIYDTDRPFIAAGADARGLTVSAFVRETVIQAAANWLAATSGEPLQADEED